MRSASVSASMCVCFIFLTGLFAAAAFHRNGIWHDDLVLWKSVADNNPGSFNAQYGLGDCYYDLGDLLRAAHHYENAVALRPDSNDARFNLGITYINQNRVREAIRELFLVLWSDPQNADAHYNLGIAYEKQGMLAAAKNEHRTALRLRPDFSKAVIALTDLEQQMSAKQFADE